MRKKLDISVWRCKNIVIAQINHAANSLRGCAWVTDDEAFELYIDVSEKTKMSYLGIFQLYISGDYDYRPISCAYETEKEAINTVERIKGLLKSVNGNTDENEALVFERVI